MARITVEDCLDHVDNRFELVMVSSKRARQLATAEKTHFFLGKMISPLLWHCAKLKQA